MADQVKLHGYWISPYVYRVIWALKFKGIAYEYIEEDLSNKSPQLLQHSPVAKKVPLLIHEGKPICESMVIVEYIDEVWPHKALLPKDPHERAVARFWIRYVDDKLPAVWALFQKTGEEREKAQRDTLEMLKTIEEQALGDKKFFGGDDINILDISVGAIIFIQWSGDMIKFNENFPRLSAWAKNFEDVSSVKENLPDGEKLKALILDKKK